MAERRRRRLAVNGDGTGTNAADVGEEKSLPDSVPAELCAASPWIPRSPWKLWTLSILLFAGLIGLGFMIFRTPEFRTELAPVLNPLFLGEQPRLLIYLETVFWTLAGQLALLVGWHRANSRLDFRGRYRIWPWAAAALFFCGFCAATNMHVGLGTVVYQMKLMELSGPKASWLLPAVCLTLPLWMLIDRDLRRSLASVILFRTAIVCLLGGAVVGMWGASWIDPVLVGMTETLCGLFGPAVLMLSFWVHGRYVAYVTPDPPVSTPFKFPKLNFRMFNLFGWLFGLITGLFRRKPAAPAPRRRKKAEEAGPAKRKRKTKRAVKPRTKKVVEEESEEETAEEESEEDYEEESSETGDEESYEDEDAEEASRSDRTPVAKPNFEVTHSRPQENRPVAPPAAASNKWSAPSNASSNDDDDEDDDAVDEDGKMYRVDGPPAEMLKGLSKRQKRAMQQQWREQQRGQKGR